MKDNIKGGITEVEWKQLKPLQPHDLKAKENVADLKTSLRNHGFSFPFGVWKNGGEYFLIDGHTRKTALTELEEEGIKVPPKLKAFEIKAKDRKEAISILLDVYNQKHNKIIDEVMTDWNCSPKLSNSGNSKESRFKPHVLEELSTKCTLFKFVIADENDIEEVLKDFDFIPRETIYLMPASENIEELNENRIFVAELCKKHGYKFTTRLQIDIWNEKTGV